MPFAERYAFPIDAEIGTSVPRSNDFKELFYVRWGRIRFDVLWGDQVNLKAVLKVCRSDDTCEHFIVDTDAYHVQWNRHERVTRDFYVHPFPLKLDHQFHETDPLQLRVLVRKMLPFRGSHMIRILEALD